MDKKGFIFIIENNQGDYKIFLDIFRELGFSNEILYFNSGDDVYDYIQKNAVQPFLVFLDIVLLQMEKSKLSTISYKNLDSIFNCPCLFYTTFFEQCFVIDAYADPVKSHFIKPYNYDKFKDIVNGIRHYWQKEKSVANYNSKNSGDSSES